MKDRPKYKRVLLELSGEMMGSEKAPIDTEMLSSVASQLKDIVCNNVQVAVVVGAGNIWRGAGKQKIIKRERSDMIGMLATVINALALQGALENTGVPSHVLSAINFEPVVETKYIGPYVSRDAIERIEKGEIVIFGAGTGNPFFTTDTASALRALQIEADALLKATKVDGVYSEDPVKNPNATKFHSLSSEEALKMDLKVMDASAFSLCKDNGLPIIVFSLHPEGNIKRVIFGEDIGTIITPNKV